MMVIGVGLFILFVSYIQLKPLFREKQKKEIYVYIGLMILAAYLSIGRMLNLYIPNPTNGIRLLFQPVQQWIDQLLS
ncbi:hypothetical protein [Tepidibacillus sp. LV47]|uniref:hypothetical protein n=1 Tax=Tepidibacillus sp. LV47 TaxID=3398228 RepID=UPI003AAF8251